MRQFDRQSPTYPRTLACANLSLMANRGRPPLLSDEAILEAALRAFANEGYTAMSVRALNAELGLSHETISKRFGAKSELFRAAVGFGLEIFIADFNAEFDADNPTGDLEQLRATVRAFMIAASRNPTLGELMHHEGIDDAERNSLIGDLGIGERITEIASLLVRLHAAGVIRDTKLRELWFLAQGAVGPLHYRALAKMFDPFDGPVDDEELISRMTDAIMRSMGVGIFDGLGAESA